MALEIFEDACALSFLDQAFPRHEVADRNLFLHAHMQSGKFTVEKSGEKKRGLAQCLGRKRSSIGRRASERGLLLDQSNLLAEIGGLRSTLFACGAGTDHDQFILLLRHGSVFLIL